MSDSEKNWLRWAERCAVCLLIAAGVGLRVNCFLAERCLWLDEAMLCLNILERSPAELLQPLDRDQVAPAGFLLGTKLCTWLFGPHERALRLLPLLAGVASVPLFYLLARRMLGRPAALIALALFAFHGPLIGYAAEAKQYAFDVLCGVAILLAATPWLENSLGRRHALVPRQPCGDGSGATGSASVVQSIVLPPRTGNASGTHRSETEGALALIVTGLVAPWFSLPAIFFLAGVGMLLLLCAIVKRDRKMCLLTVLVGSLWLGSFAAHYFLMAAQTQNHVLVDYWERAFPPRDGSAAETCRWLYHTAVKFMYSPGDSRFVELVLLVCVVGVTAVWFRRKSTAWLLLSPAAFALAACFLQKYPLEGRLLLFLVPPFLLVCAAGLAQLMRSASATSRVGTIGAGLLCLPIVAWPAKNAVEAASRPQHNQIEQIAVALDHVARHIGPDDTVYVYEGAIPAFEYYTQYGPFGPLRRRPVLWARTLHGDPASYAADVERLAAHRRVWMLFSHVWQDPVADADEQDILTRLAARQGRLVSRFSAPGAAVVLFEFSGQTTPTPRRRT